MTSDEEFIETILEVRLNAFVLSDGMFAYLDRRGVLFFPLRDYVELLDFPIDVDAEGTRASGWFLRENRLFSLRLDKTNTIIEGQREQFDRSRVRQIFGELCVDVRLLAKWFPVDIDFDLASLIVTLSTREPIPLEQRIAREERRSKALGQKGDAGSLFETVDNPHRWIGWPSIDTSIDMALNDNGTTRAKSFSHSSVATADVGKMHGEFYVGGTHLDAVSNARLKLSRTDPGAGLLGPVKATEFAVGDVVSPQLPLISKTELGRGATVSSFPVGRASEFDRITLEGDLTSGWEVEVYRNEVLLNYSESRSDGRYVFEDVPLLFGVNNIRLVFYGPQGQVRQEIKQVRVGPGQVKPSEHHFRLTVNQHQKTLFELDDTEAAVSEDHAKPRLFGEYETGVNKNLSLAGHLASFPIEGERHTYVGGGLRTSLGNVYGGLDATRDLTGGWATKAAAQTSLFGASVVAEHDRYFDFTSEQTGTGDNALRHRTDIRLDGVARLGSLPHVPFSFTNRHDVLMSGDSTTSLDNRLSTGIGRATYTNTLSWNYDKSDDSGVSTLSGTSLVGGRVWDLHLRGRLGYEVLPLKELSTASVTADWKISEDYSADLGVNMDLAEEGTTIYSAGVSTRFKYLSMGLNFDYDTAQEYLVRLTMSFSLAKDPRGGVHVRSGGLAGGGMVSARVYQDNNFNRAFDEGDQPLKGVRFMGGRQAVTGETDAEGVALISGLSTTTATDFSVDMGSLEDPFSVSDPEGVSIALRPGVPAMLEFPVVSTGEIDGIVYRRKGDWSTEVADAVVQLIGADGDVATQVESAFDGFYLMSFVRPGRYTLRVDPDQAERLNLIAPEPRQVEIEADGTILSAQDFVYEEEESAAAGDRSFRVRLADFLTQADAERGWRQLFEALPSAFDGLSSMVERAPNPTGEGDMFTLFASDLSSRAAAKDLCTDIQTLGELWCNPMTIQMR
jgi:hypothetical protein